MLEMKASATDRRHENSSHKCHCPCSNGMKYMNSWHKVPYIYVDTPLWQNHEFWLTKIEPLGFHYSSLQPAQNNKRFHPHLSCLGSSVAVHAQNFITQNGKSSQTLFISNGYELLFGHGCVYLKSQYLIASAQAFFFSNVYWVSMYCNDGNRSLYATLPNALNEKRTMPSNVSSIQHYFRMYKYNENSNGILKVRSSFVLLTIWIFGLL